MNFAIKCLETVNYMRNYQVNNIDESMALYLCQASPNIISFTEKFQHSDKKTYIVTKLADGGHLCDYLNKLGVN